MNEITIHGTVATDPELRYGSDGEATAILLFSVAVNCGYRSRETGEWVEQSAVFHDVAAFGSVADDAAKTLEKGMTVTVTGQLEDVSYLHGDSGHLACRERMDAADIAVGVR